MNNLFFYAKSLLSFRKVFRFIKDFFFLFFISFLFLLYPQLTLGSEYPSILFQGNIVIDGEPYSSTDSDVLVTIYKDTIDTAGTVYSEEFNNVVFSDGLFEVELGIDTENSLLPSFFDSDNWIEFVVDDYTDIITINTVSKSFYSFFAEETPTGNLFPSLTTSPNHLVIISSDESSFSYISTSNLFTLLDLNSAATVNLNELGDAVTLAELITSSSYWDAAYLTSNMITDTLVSSWNYAYSFSTNFTSSNILSWNNAAEFNSLFPDTSPSPNTVVVVNDDGSAYSYITTSNLFSLLDLGTAAYLDDTDIGNASEVSDLMTSGNFWDMAYTSSNRIHSQDISNWNSTYTSMNLITSAYLAVLWDQAVSSANLIDSSYLANNWDEAYNFYTSFNVTQDPGFVIFKDNTYQSISTSNIFDIDTASSGFLFIQQGQFYVDSIDTVTWNAFTSTANLLPSVSQSGYALMVQNDSITTVSTSNWNQMVTTFNFISSEFISSLNQSVITSNLFPNKSSTLNTFVKINSSSTEFSYVSSTNIFQDLNLGSAALLSDSEVGTAASVNALLQSVSDWDSMYTTSNQLSALEISQWNAALATANKIPSFNNYNGYVFMINESDNTISYISTQNWNQAVATTNLLTTSRIASWNLGIATSNLFSNIPTINDSVLVINASATGFEAMSSSNLFSLLDLGTSALVSTNVLGLQSDIQALTTSSNYWDTAYATSNLIHDTQLASWNYTTTISSQFLNNNPTQFDQAYITANLIISTSTSNWNEATATFNIITNTYIEQWTTLNSIMSQISSNNRAQFDSSNTTANAVYSTATSNWNAAVSSFNQITTLDITQWNASYATFNLISAPSMNYWSEAFLTSNRISSSNIDNWNDTYALFNSFDDTNSKGVVIYKDGSYVTVSTLNALGISSSDTGLLHFDGSNFSLISSYADNWEDATTTFNRIPTFSSSSDGFVVMVDSDKNNLSYITADLWNQAITTANLIHSADIDQWDDASDISSLIPKINSNSNHFLIINSSGTEYDTQSTSNLFSALSLGSAATFDSTHFATSSDVTALISSSNLWNTATLTSNLLTSSYISQWNNAASSANLFGSLDNYHGYLLSLDNSSNIEYISSENWNAMTLTSNILTQSAISSWDTAYTNGFLFPNLASSQNKVVRINESGSSLYYETTSNIITLLNLADTAFLNQSEFASSENTVILLTAADETWNPALSTSNMFPSFNTLSSSLPYLLTIDESNYSFTYTDTSDWDSAVLTANLITSNFFGTLWDNAYTTSNYFNFSNNSIQTGSLFRFDGVDFIQQSDLIISSNGQVSVGTVSPALTTPILFVQNDLFTHHFYTSGNIIADGILQADTFYAPFDDGDDLTSIVFGYNSGQLTDQQNVINDSNLFIGPFSGINTTGSYNSFFGAYSGSQTTSGAQNTAVGFMALYNQTTGEQNTALGYQSGFSGTQVTGNIFMGFQSGYTITDDNTLIISNDLSSPLLYADLENDRVGIGTSTIDSHALTVDGDTLFSNHLTVTDSMTVDLYARLGSTLNVTGSSYFNSTLFISDDMYGFSNLSTTQNLFVTGNSYFYDTITFRLNLIFDNHQYYLGEHTGIENNTVSDTFFMGTYAGIGETNSHRFYLSQNHSGTTDTLPTLFAKLDTDQIAIGSNQTENHELLVSGNAYFSGDFFVSNNLTIQDDIYVKNSIYATQFIDYDNSSYYFDPNLTSNVHTLMAHAYSRYEHHSGHLVGGFDLIGDSKLYTNPIFTIGLDDSPNSTTLGSMEGIGYGHSTSSFLSSKSNLPSGWGLYVASSNASIFLSSETGAVWAEGDVRAPIFYDTDDISYYTDPSSVSSMYKLSISTSNEIATLNIDGSSLIGNSHTASYTSNGLTISSDLSNTYSWGEDSDISDAYTLLSLSNESSNNDTYSALSFQNISEANSTSTIFDLKLLHPTTNLLFTIKDTSDSWNDALNLAYDGILYIDTSLGIGLGTDTATHPLDVVGTANISDAGSVNLILEADTDNSDESDHPQIYFRQDASSTEAAIGFFDTDDSGNRFSLYHLDDYNLTLGAGGVKDHVIIDKDGNISFANNLTVGGDLKYASLSVERFVDVDDTTYYIAPTSNSSINILRLVQTAESTIGKTTSAGKVFWNPDQDEGFVYSNSSNSDDGYMVIGTDGDGNEPIIFTQNDNTRLEIDSDNNVVISNDLYTPQISDSTQLSLSDYINNQWELAYFQDFETTTDSWLHTNVTLGYGKLGDTAPFSSLTYNGCGLPYGTVYKNIDLSNYDFTHVKVVIKYLGTESRDGPTDYYQINVGPSSSDNFRIAYHAPHLDMASPSTYIGVNYSGNCHPDWYDNPLETFEYIYEQSSTDSSNVYIAAFNQIDQSSSDEGFTIVDVQVFVK